MVKKRNIFFWKKKLPFFFVVKNEARQWLILKWCHHYLILVRALSPSALISTYTNTNGYCLFFFPILSGWQIKLSSKLVQELPEYQRGDAVSSMVYEANARVRDPVYGCVAAISSLQQQIDALQTQLALAQAEVAHLRVRQTGSFSHHGFEPTSPCLSPSASSKLMNPQAKPIFDTDMVVNYASFGESVWSCY